MGENLRKELGEGLVEIGVLGGFDTGVGGYLSDYLRSGGVVGGMRGRKVEGVRESLGAGGGECA